MMNGENLFEELALSLGCECISDMRFAPFAAEAKRAAAKLNFSDYKLTELAKLYEYLYGEKVMFFSYEQAKKAFTRRKK